ncbi:hypothetical protein [Massilia sp. TS11]|uniref:hypothetical protein n=1 Tax=Massilia sp. TS11 TaxID=2908003 RepID=UPI001EDBF6A3|nr:hypothetical protein [Massilia sp. TS11]MCG2586527.1 hypothetical protein [Massilia sp. TS11]
MEISLFWVGCAIACGIIASNKGRSVGGWIVLGFLFSIFSLIVILVLPSLSAAPGTPTAETHRNAPSAPSWC